MNKLILTFLLIISFCGQAFAAVGCSLDDPDRDVKKLFPDSTGYRTTYITLKEIGGETLQKKIEERLGDKLDPVYENLDVPYAYYLVLKGKEPIGYIHGVNQKGEFGVLQIVIAVSLQEKILDFYFQKISSPESAAFRSLRFTEQFKGLNLSDFNQGIRINNPSKNNSVDFKATLRGIKKNLILLDEFLHNQVSKGGK